MSGAPAGPDLEALPGQAALLDPAGTVLEANAAWRRWAERAGPGEGACPAGGDFLAACDASKGPCAPHAREIAKGIRTLVEKGRDDFRYVYCLPGPPDRFFAARVARLDIAGEVRLLLEHEELSGA